MGTDCVVTLPHRTRVEDVRTVLAALLGFKVTRQDLGNGGWAAHCEPNVVSLLSCGSMPQCCTISWRDAPNPALHRSHGSIFYHFENKDGRWLSMGCHPTAIAIASALVSFFGGSADFNDCDDSEDDFVVPERTDIHAEDGKEWHDLQARLLAVRPLSADELDAAKAWVR